MKNLQSLSEHKSENDFGFKKHTSETDFLIKESLKVNISLIFVNGN